MPNLLLSSPQTGFALARRLSLFVLIYIAGAELGHFLSFPSNFATFWPPAGVFLAALLLTSVPDWPALIGAAFLCHGISDVLFHGQHPLVALGFWFSNSCESLTAAYLIRRFVGHSFSLSTSKEVIRLTIMGALVSACVGATLGAVTISLSFPRVKFIEVWRIWWSADVLGVMLVTPVIVTIFRVWADFSRDYRFWQHWHSSGSVAERLVQMRKSLATQTNFGRFGEMVLVFSTLMLSTQVVFGHDPNPLAFLVFPVLFWIALRFGMNAITMANLQLAIVAIWNTRLGFGPFSGDHSIANQLVLLQSFLSIACGSSMILAAIVTERRHSSQVVQENEERYRDLLENVNDLVHSVGPDGRILYANRAWRESLGYTENEISMMFVFEVMHPEEMSACYERLRRVFSGENVAHWESRLVTKSGCTIIVEGSCNCRMIDGKPVATRAIFRDITKRREHEQELETYRCKLEEANQQLLRQATTDGLTELQNRRAFQTRLEEEVERGRRYCSPLSLLLLDIDFFKQFNDKYGHPAGDEVLKRVARILESTARTSDLVCRFGGEEFAVILPSTGEAESQLLAERFRLAIQDFPWMLRRITASVGVATASMEYPEVGPSFDGSTLIKSADEALYDSKRRGRNRSSHAVELNQIEA